MPRAGPRKVQRYSLEFKLKAVKLSQLKDVEVQAVAEALEIHPFMLSRWRKQARDGSVVPPWPSVSSRDPTRYCRALISERRRAANRLPKALQDTPRFVALNHRTAEGRPESRGRPEQAADASDVKRRGGAEVRVGCSGAAAT